MRAGFPFWVFLDQKVDGAGIICDYYYLLLRVSHTGVYNIPRLLTGVYGLRTGVMLPFGHDAVKTDAIQT